MTQTVLVYIIGAALLLWIGWRVWRIATGRAKSGCSGCSGCPGCRQDQPSDHKCDCHNGQCH